MPMTKVSAALIARGTSNAAFTQLTGAAAVRVGTTATYTKAAHGLANGDPVLIQGFSLEEFNGVFTVANALAGSFDVTIKQDPGANPAGLPGTIDKVTRGTALDLTTAYGCHIIGGIQNTTTGPTIPAQVWMGVSNSGAAEGDFIWRPIQAGVTTANEWSPFSVSLQQAAQRVNIVIARNTGQAVDCFAQASYITAV